MSSTGRLTTVDQVVGASIRRRRRELGYNQTALAKALGISYQQVQKFEKGANRISAVQLHIVSKLLKMPMELFFFKGHVEE